MGPRGTARHRTARPPHRLRATLPGPPSKPSGQEKVQADAEARPLVSLLFLIFTAAGVWLNWHLVSPVNHALSLFMCLMFAIAVGISISIGFDRSGRIPWWRMGTAVLLIALAMGVAWVRGMI